MNAILVQLLSTIILSILTMLSSFAIAWPSYTIPLLESDHSPLSSKITAYDGNLIGSLPMLGSLIACLLCGYVSEVIGRKHTVLLCGICFALGWSLISTAKTIVQILIARLAIGFGIGMNIVVVFVYTSEINQISIKGTMAVVLTFAYNFGTLLSYVQGWLCSYDIISYSNLTCSVISIVLVSFFLKETPSYLLGRGKEKEALNSLKFYRGVSKSTQDVLDELAYIRKQRFVNKNDVKNITPGITSDLEICILKTENEKLQKENGAEENIEISGWKLLFISKANQRALITLSLEMSLAVCTGLVAVLTYAEKFFEKATSSMSPQMSSILLAIFMMAGSLVSLVITDRVGRRVLMTSTCLVATGCLAAIASLLRWSWGPDWFLTAFVLIYCANYQLGVINVPFVQLTESFEPKVNSMALAIILCFMYSANFAVLFIYGPAVEVLGLDGAFFIFAIIGLLTSVITFLIVKETRKLPIEVVQQMYAQGYLWYRDSAGFQHPASSMCVPLSILALRSSSGG